MELDDEDISIALLRYKTRIIFRFVFAVLQTILFLCLSFYFFAIGNDEVGRVMVALTIFSTLLALGFGIYLYSKRNRRYRNNKFTNDD